MNKLTQCLFVSVLLSCSVALGEMNSNLSYAQQAAGTPSSYPTTSPYQTTSAYQASPSLPPPPAPNPSNGPTSTAMPSTMQVGHLTTSSTVTQIGSYAAAQPTPSQSTTSSPTVEKQTFTSPFSHLFDTGSTPRWTVSADALWLTRDLSRGVYLGYTDYNPNASDFSQATRPSNLWSNDVVFPLAAGVRLQLTAYATDEIAFELNGFGLQKWSASRTIYGDSVNDSVLAYTPYLVICDDIAGFDRTLGYTYKSEVAGAEINQRFKFLSDGLFRSASWLWGVRYFHLSDDFSLSGTDVTTNSSETVAWHTKNNLVGAQLGLRCDWSWDRLQFITEIKGGLFANIHDQNGTDDAVEYGIASSDSAKNSSTDLSALFELSLMLRYQITQCLAVRGGYQYIGVSGLALGPRQLQSYGDFRVFNNNGSVSMNGLWAGVELVR